MFPYRPKPCSQCAFSQTVLPENGTLWYIMLHEQTRRDMNNCTRTTSQGSSEPGSKCGGRKWLYISPICTGLLPVLCRYKQFSGLSTTENPAQSMEFLLHLLALPCLMPLPCHPAWTGRMVAGLVIPMEITRLLHISKDPKDEAGSVIISSWLFHHL